MYSQSELCFFSKRCMCPTGEEVCIGEQFQITVVILLYVGAQKNPAPEGDELAEVSHS